MKGGAWLWSSTEDNKSLSTLIIEKKFTIDTTIRRTNYVTKVVAVRSRSLKLMYVNELMDRYGADPKELKDERTYYIGTTKVNNNSASMFGCTPWTTIKDRYNLHDPMISTGGESWDIIMRRLNDICDAIIKSIHERVKETVPTAIIAYPIGSS